MSVDWFYALAGLCVGALVGMTGVGGGSLMTPLLILLFGIHPATAVGTDLLYAAITKTGGTLIHGIGRTIEWRVVALLAVGSVPMTVLTLLALSRVDIGGAQVQGAITMLLGFALLATALALIFRSRLLAACAGRMADLSQARVAALTIATGAGLGVLVSVTSVGAGALGVTALILLHPRLPTLRIVGTDIAHAVPLALVAGAGHWLIGSVDVGMLGSLLLGSLPGIAFGSYMAARVPDGMLRVTLAAVLAVIGLRLIA